MTGSRNSSRQPLHRESASSAKTQRSLLTAVGVAGAVMGGAFAAPASASANPNFLTAAFPAITSSVVDPIWPTPQGPDPVLTPQQEPTSAPAETKTATEPAAAPTTDGWMPPAPAPAPSETPAPPATEAPAPAATEPPAPKASETPAPAATENKPAEQATTAAATPAETPTVAGTFVPPAPVEGAPAAPAAPAPPAAPSGPAATGKLPRTGPKTDAALLGGGLVLIGAALVMASRRRDHESEALA